MSVQKNVNGHVTFILKHRSKTYNNVFIKGIEMYRKYKV